MHSNHTNYGANIEYSFHVKFLEEYFENFLIDREFINAQK